MAPDPNGWEEYKKLVLSDLKRLNEAHTTITSKLDTISSEIAALKVKAGFWGVMGGMIPVLIAISILLIKGHF